MFKLESLRQDGFSWRAALSLAVASRVSYDGAAAVRRAAQSWGFDRTVVIDIGRTQGFVAESRDVLLIAFRGTAGASDWIGNLNLSWTKRPYGSIHAGFYEGYALAASTVTEAVSAAARANKKIWYAGHSLGGALAAIAAAELKHVGAATGIYTFGQPRLADQVTTAWYKTNLHDRFYRFVNDEDPVTRLPPGFEPVGRIIHFDASGNIDRTVFENEAGATEPAPLSREEFEALQRDIKAVEARVRTSGVEASAEAVDLTIEGLWPDFDDHRIDRYVAVISRIVTRDEERVDSAVMLLSDNRKQLRLRDAGTNDTAMVELSADSELLPALVRLRSDGWKAPETVRVNSQFGSFATIQATRADLLKLQNDPKVSSVEASRDSGVEDLSVSVPFVKATAVHRPTIAERGSHALVGLIDTGIDVLHEAFRDAVGATRIVAVWDQKNPSGPSPKAFDPYFSQDFGTLYTAAEINGFAAAGSAPTALRDPQAHGTHVASIAAGRAVGALADGVAPDAGIIVVIPDWKTNPGDAPSLGYSNSHVDALHFLKFAAAGGNKLIGARKPIAVNISLGMNAGAHDGNSILEGMFDALSANGREPGFVIVKSAGNERGQAGHARIKTFLGRQVVEWNSLAAGRLEDYVEIWYDALDSNEFTLVAPCGTPSSTLSAATPNVRAVLGGNVCRMQFTQFHPDNGDSRVVITIAEGATPIQTGIWQLVIDGTVVRSGFPHIDLWVERNNARAVRFTRSEDEGTLSIPGTARSVISVGACHSRMPLLLLSASSFGLTRDRRAKPDLCAPGVDIVAARANTANHRDTIAYPGTSMAAPHVAGAIALVMSHREQRGLTHHNAQQFRAALVRTSVGLSGGHHEGFGFGMLDAEQLFHLLK